MSLKVYQSKNPRYAGHTTGPWMRAIKACHVVSRVELRSVTWVDYDPRRDRECDANAALIADAPYLACEVERLRELCGELVGALTELTEFVESEADEAGLCEYVESEKAYREASAKARAKIDKAKGGDQ